MSRATGQPVRVGLKGVIGVLLALVVPGLACYCYHVVTEISPGRAGWAPAVALAVPLTLVSAVGLCAALLTATPRPRVTRACATVLGASTLLVLVAELHAFGF